MMMSGAKENRHKKIASGISKNQMFLYFRETKLHRLGKDMVYFYVSKNKKYISI